MRMTVVTGPPCAGKTTHVAEHARPDDLVVDYDAIATALGLPDAHGGWGSDAGVEHVAVAAARIARNAVVSALTRGQLARPGARAWVIDSRPAPTSLRIFRRIGASVETIDPGRVVCHDRATMAGRPAATHAQIDRWYDRRPAPAGRQSAPRPQALGVFD